MILPNNKVQSYWSLHTANTTHAHCGLQSIFHPLYSPYENSPNPCFVALVTAALHLLLSVFSVYQIIQLIYHNTYGPHKIKYSFGSSLSRSSIGWSQFVKLLAISVQLILLGILLGTNFKSIRDVKSISLLSIVLEILFVAIPLHIIEPTRSIIPSASLLFFWLVNILSTATWLLQDIFSSHKIFQPNASLYPLNLSIEIVLFLNSISILVLEVQFYAPTNELIDYFQLNEWDTSILKNYFSELSIYWIEATIREIYQNDELNEDEINLPKMPLEMYTDVVQPNLKKFWNYEKVKKSPNLLFPILRANLFNFTALYLLNLTEAVIAFAQPFLLQRLLQFFTAKTSKTEDASPPIIVGISIVIGMAMISVSRFILFNRGYVVAFDIIFAVQSSLSAMVYEKALSLSPEARKLKPSGDIINHLSTDVYTIEEISTIVPETINNPIRLVICLVSLHKILGNAAWGGFAAALLLVPLSTKVSTSIFSLYNEALEFKDARMSLTTEIFNSIKSIKLYAWEKPMLERLDEVRNKKELVTNKRIGVFNAFSIFLWSCIPFCISCASFATYVYISDIPLTPSMVFPALALFEMLSEPLLMLPDTFSSIAEIRVSLNRLKDFFLMDELENTTLVRTYNKLEPNEISVELKNISFVWKVKEQSQDEDELSSGLALSNINFTAAKGQLTCIVGKVGSGKTTLIKSILGELPVSSGRGVPPVLNVNGTIAYCAQSPWILNATIKENILFGCRYDKDFYDKTVKACELLSDFKTLPDGDKTVVGEKGISLSGGQKARVSLARAVYARADIYLLDDVLSAVDAHVGENIAKNVLGENGILATKTKILATNSVRVLAKAHKIALIKSGSIVETGTYPGVMKDKKSDLAELINEFGQEQEEESEVNEVDNEGELNLASESASIATTTSDIVNFQPDASDGQKVHRRGSIGTASLVTYLHNYEDEDDVVDFMNEDGLPRPPRKTGHTKENNSKGRVKFEVYLEYFKACNYKYVLLYLILMASTIGSEVLGNYTLKYWSEINESEGHNIKPAKYLGFYAVLGVAAGALTLTAAFVVWTYCIIRSSTYFHDTMAYRVLRSPMSFFETTPIGRLLNRFSEDMDRIDSDLPWAFIDFLELLLQGISIIGVLMINVPPMIIIVILLMIVYNEIRRFFVPASRELKRVRSARKSPIFSHFQESVNGVETLRAYNQEERFIVKSRSYLDGKVGVDYLVTMCNRWLSFRLQSISTMLMFATGLLIILTINTKFQLTVGLAGFVMTYALNTSNVLNAIVRRWAEVESRSVSIERIVEYCHLPSEAEVIIEDNRPKTSWPLDGSIKFDDYSTKYRENLDPVLKNINIDIKAGEKIGIVGRTGAGKSSLTLALFRIIESTTGNISIDNIDTSGIGLFDLRSNLSIIPQDSHTVEGSVRQNLDPFGRHSDDELWRVLELAHLKEHVESMKTSENDTNSDSEEEDNSEEPENVLEGLDAKVYEGGSNLSSGQKQLLCLARALLNPSKVLILDEATAAVDVQTDKIIQDTIRQEFKDKTILTIAHRLDTIMDSDRVIVLDKGEVKEFASVPELLANTDGIFYSLCNEGGYLKNR